MLGKATFEVIRIRNGILEHIEEEFLSVINNAKTLQTLDLHRNQLTNEGLPVASLQDLTSLTELELYSNNINHIPLFESSSLRIINVGHNPLQILPSSALKQLPMLEEFYAESIGINEINPGGQSD